MIRLAISLGTLFLTARKDGQIEATPDSVLTRDRKRWLHFMGMWCNGSASGLYPANEGSIPSIPTACYAMCTVGFRKRIPFWGAFLVFPEEEKDDWKEFCRFAAIIVV